MARLSFAIPSGLGEDGGMFGRAFWAVVAVAVFPVRAEVGADFAALEARLFGLQRAVRAVFEKVMG